MPKSDTQIVSFRLPSKLIAAIDKLVKPPVVKDRTQWVEIQLTKAVQESTKQ